MSAAKLEKKIWNLEQRLRDEFRGELRRVLTQCASKIQELETEVLLLKGEKPTKAAQEVSVDFSQGTHPELPGELGGHAVQPVDVVPACKAAWPELGEFPTESKHQDSSDWVPLEPVAFLESTWNIVLVLGFTDAGWLDIIVGCLLLLASAGLQIAFSIILLSEGFLGKPFKSNIDSAEKWRVGIAHDYRHMDLAETSLVSRVCGRDDSLIVSTSQATLLGQIDAFLGLGESSEFEPLGLRLGILLCMLCILLWCLYLCNEFRAIGLSLEAICQVPRRLHTTFDQGRFTTMSYFRFALYCGARLVRGIIAGLLLYAGILWLGNTTSITDLMLNAVALGAVLDVDEMFFAALMPKKIQIKIQDLEAIKITYSRRRSQMEAILLLLIMTGLMLWPWFHLVEPLGNDMLEVKKKLCWGKDNFVVGVNSNQGVTVGRWTNDFNSKRNESLIDIAVGDFAFDENSVSSIYILMTQEAKTFENRRTESIAVAAASLLQCDDLDEQYLNDAQNSATGLNYGPYFFNTAPGLGYERSAALALTCEEMSVHCNEEEGQLLRMVCGSTCGCDQPDANPWYRVVNTGCPPKCLESVQGKLDEATFNCTDSPTDSSAWQTFWDMYPEIMKKVGQMTNSSEIAELRELAEQYRNGGCPFLSGAYEPVTGFAFCTGHADWFAPLSMLCPLTCCNGADSLYCPLSCACSDDDKEMVESLPNNSIFNGITTCSAVAAANLCTERAVIPHCKKSCGTCHEDVE